MPLNDLYDFAKAPRSHQEAFTKHFGVHRILLSSGTELYKLTQHGLVSPSGTITPWWNFYHTTTLPLPNGTTITVPGWSEMAARATGLGVTDEQFGRARSAVTKQWNTMSGTLKARLNIDAYGWFGQNSAMPLDNSVPDPKKVVFIGGAYQVYIPNLMRGMMT